jgi:hypothetical protein
MARPDFGEDVKYHEGVKLTCRRIAPGLTLHDLTMIFDRASKEARPEDHLSANPSKWPTVRGVNAVTEAILDAIYGAK